MAAAQQTGGPAGQRVSRARIGKVPTGRRADAPPQPAPRGRTPRRAAGSCGGRRNPADGGAAAPSRLAGRQRGEDRPLPGGRPHRKAGDQIAFAGNGVRGRPVRLRPPHDGSQMAVRIELVEGVVVAGRHHPARSDMRDGVADRAGAAGRREIPLPRIRAVLGLPGKLPDQGDDRLDAARQLRGDRRGRYLPEGKGNPVCEQGEQIRLQHGIRRAVGVPRTHRLHQASHQRHGFSARAEPFRMRQQRDGEHRVAVQVVDENSAVGRVETEQQRIRDLPAGRGGGEPDAAAVVVEAETAAFRIQGGPLHHTVQRDAARRQLFQPHGCPRQNSHLQTVHRHDRGPVQPSGPHPFSRHYLSPITPAVSDTGGPGAICSRNPTPPPPTDGPAPRPSQTTALTPRHGSVKGHPSRGISAPHPAPPATHGPVAIPLGMISDPKVKTQARRFRRSASILVLQRSAGSASPQVRALIQLSRCGADAERTPLAGRAAARRGTPETAPL